jgi:ribosomal protein L37E
MNKTYEILATDLGPAIKCLLCGLRSYHPVDVEQKYCANCHIFHEDQPVCRD